MNLIIYHADCWDGLCAAWICRKALGPNCEFISCQYGDKAPCVDNKDVYIVDFSFKRDVLQEIYSRANSVLVLDHHKTAQSELNGLPYCKFDMTKSGAKLAWEHFFPENESSWIVNYIEDRDLWLWKLPHSKILSAAIRSYPMTFDTLDDLEQSEGYKVQNKLKDEGEAILRAQQQIVDGLVKNAIEVNIDGYLVLIVNATCYISEVAGELAKGRPFGVVWFETNDGKRVYSLRADSNGIDVAEFAKKYGGGGHAKAAGFSTPNLRDNGIYLA